MNKKKLIITIILILIFAGILTQAAEAAFSDGLKNGVGKIAGFFENATYQKYAKTIDFILFFFLILAGTLIGLKAAFKEKGVDKQIAVFAVAFSLLAAFSLIWGAQKFFGYEVSIKNLLPFFGWFLFLLLSLLVYWVLSLIFKPEGFFGKLMLLLASAALVFLMFWGFGKMMSGEWDGLFKGFGGVGKEKKGLNESDKKSVSKMKEEIGSIDDEIAKIDKEIEEKNKGLSGIDCQTAVDNPTCKEIKKLEEKKAELEKKKLELEKKKEKENKKLCEKLDPPVDPPSARDFIKDKTLQLGLDWIKSSREVCKDIMDVCGNEYNKIIPPNNIPKTPQNNDEKEVVLKYEKAKACYEFYYIIDQGGSDENVIEELAKFAFEGDYNDSVYAKRALEIISEIYGKDDKAKLALAKVHMEVGNRLKGLSKTVTDAIEDDYEKNAKVEYQKSLNLINEILKKDNNIWKELSTP